LTTSCDAGSTKHEWRKECCVLTLCYSTRHQMAIYWKLSNFQIHSLNCLMDWIAMSNQVSKSLG
jgi:hypothetical protein